jgi:fructose/tagatose bisphosphate aldolase
MNKYRSGVLYGKELEALYNDAKANNFAIPAVNTTGTDTINAFSFLTAVHNLLQVRVCQMTICKPIFKVR